MSLHEKIKAIIGEDTPERKGITFNLYRKRVLRVVHPDKGKYGHDDFIKVTTLLDVGEELYEQRIQRLKKKIALRRRFIFNCIKNKMVYEDKTRMPPYKPSISRASLNSYKPYGKIRYFVQARDPLKKRPQTLLETDDLKDAINTLLYYNVPFNRTGSLFKNW